MARNESTKKMNKHKDSTKRKLLQMSVFKAFVDSANVIIQSVDKQGKLVYVNRKWKKALGYTSREAAQMSFADIIRKDQHAHCTEVFKSLIKGKSWKNVETVFVTKSGKQIPVNGCVSSIMHEYSFECTIGFFYDISRQKRAEEELKKSTKKYSQLVETLNEGIWVIDETGVTTYVNPKMAEILGYTQAEMKGKHLFYFMDENAKESARKKLAKRKTGVSEQHDFEFRKKDGQRIHALLGTSPILEDGTYKGAVAAVQDITQIRRAQDAMGRRLAYESALAEILVAMMNEPGSERVNEMLSALLKATGTSRVYIFENFHDKKDGLCTRQAFEAVAEGVETQIHNPELSHVHYASTLQRWKRKLSKGGMISGFVRNFPKGEKEILEAQDIKSILVLPIFSAGKWLGFIGFDETKAEKEFERQDVSVLQTAANVIGKYYELKEYRQRLEQIRKAINNSADSLYLIERQSMMFVEVNDTACASMGYSRKELLSLGPQDIKPLLTKAQLEAKFDEIIGSDSQKGEISTLHQRKDGSKFPVEVKLTYVEQDSKQIIIASVRDVSEKVEAQKKLNEKVELLERFKNATIEQVLQMKHIEEENVKLKRIVEKMRQDP